MVTRPSRSDRVMVAVGFSRLQPTERQDIRSRRVATHEGERKPISSVATRRGVAAALFRGLKPSATINASLRDAELATSSKE